MAPFKSVSVVILLMIGLMIGLVGCAAKDTPQFPDSPRLDAAKNIVDAVNAKASQRYIRDLDEDVVVTMYDDGVILRGREAIQANRDTHFKTFPEARNELVHLVEIDDRVVMHDKVWLKGEASQPSDIVEIFTFEGDKIIRIDVIQSRNLLEDR